MKQVTAQDISPYEMPPRRDSRTGGCGVYGIVIVLGVILSALVCAGIVLYFPDPDDPPTPTVRFVPTNTLTPSITVTPSPTATASDTPTATNSPTSTTTPSITVTPSLTPTATFTASDTPSNTPTWTFTPSDTPTATLTPSETFTPSDTPTDTPTSTHTPTNTATFTLTYTPSNTSTATSTSTSTATSTNTSTFTPTFTFTPTPTPLTRTITLVINSLSTDNIQEDIIVGDNVDEIRLIYEIQEVDPSGNLVDATEIENTYQNEGVRAGANLTTFDSLTITIPSSHSIRVRIRLIEDDRTVVGGFVVNESSNTFTPIVVDIYSADEILNNGGVITRSTILTDDDFLRSAQYDLEYSIFMIQ